MKPTHQPVAWIFANGSLPQPDALFALVHPADTLIAADGGARHLLRAGRTPQVLVGDLDSLTSAEVEQIAAAGAEILRYPTDKDWTDLELALAYAVQQGFARIRIAAAGGGRLDQQLGNLFLLAHPDLGGWDAALEDGREEIFLLRQQLTLHGSPGDRVSLIPLDEQVIGVTTQGLQWPLQAETLARSATRGISNVMTADTAQISVQSGSLICIHTRKEFLDDVEAK